MDKPKVKTYVHSKTYPVNSIRIPKAFALTTPSEAKIEQCLSFYIENGYFDREIILNNNGFLVDGYIKYLVVKAAEVEKIKVLQVHTEITYPAPPEPIKPMGFWARFGKIMKGERNENCIKNRA